LPPPARPAILGGMGEEEDYADESRPSRWGLTDRQRQWIALLAYLAGPSVLFAVIALGCYASRRWLG
jgi:hypothetical protein